MEISTHSLTLSLSECIVNAHPSKEALQAAQQGVMDYIAVCFAGRNNVGVKKLITLYSHKSEKNGVPIIGQEICLPHYEASLINGFLGHVLDFDDVHSEVRGHPSTVILPALISVVSMQDIFTYKNFLAAYCVGVEVMARLGNAIGSEHFVRGWHNTSTLGVIAATAAIGYLKHFSKEQIAKAIGFAVTQASGLRVQFGTEAKPLHAGLAAQAALRSIDFVEVDLGGTLYALDGILGFFHVYGQGENFAKPLLLKGWNVSWKIVSPGLWFKIYPFCSAAHHAADAARELLAKYTISSHQIQNVRVVFPSTSDDAALVYKNPKTGEEGRFSVEYVLSLIFNDYPLSLKFFNQEPIQNNIYKFMSKISRVYDNSIRPAPDAIPSGRFTIIEVILTDGKMYHIRVDTPKGCPKNPLSLKDQAQKLKTCIDDELLSFKVIHKLFSVDYGESMKSFFDFT